MGPNHIGEDDDDNNHDREEVETDYAEIAYSSDESEDEERNLNVEESDDEVIMDDNGNYRLVSKRSDKEIGKRKEENSSNIMSQGVFEARRKMRESMKQKGGDVEENFLYEGDEADTINFAPSCSSP